MVTAFCIIVSYRPVVPRLLDLCGRLAADGARVVLVDNTEVPALTSADLPDGCTLIALGHNSGIAHAQNVGVRTALDAGAEVLLFFDQDSKVEAGLVKGLTGALNPQAAEVVSPLCFDEATGMAVPAEEIGRYGWSRQVHRAAAAARYPVDIVISSGMTVTRQAFERVGLFDEDFFIDFVDSEWCLRCRARQIPIYVVPNVVMRHSIGSRHIQLGPLGVSVHSAARCYYQIRNCFLLFRKPHVPFLFALKQLTITLGSRLLLLRFVESRRSYLKAYLLAVRDGLAGRTGAGPA